MVEDGWRNMSIAANLALQRGIIDDGTRDCLWKQPAEVFIRVSDVKIAKPPI